MLPSQHARWSVDTVGNVNANNGGSVFAPMAARGTAMPAQERPTLPGATRMSTGNPQLPVSSPQMAASDMQGVGAIRRVM